MVLLAGGRWLTCHSYPREARSHLPGRQESVEQVTLVGEAIEHLVVPQLRQLADLLGPLLDLVPGARGGGVRREGAAHRVGADRGLGRGVLRPVEEDLAGPLGL